MKLKRSHIITLAVCLLIVVAIMSEAHYHSSVKKIREEMTVAEHIAQHHNHGGNTTPVADALRDRAESSPSPRDHSNPSNPGQRRTVDKIRDETLRKQQQQAQHLIPAPRAGSAADPAARVGACPVDALCSSTGSCPQTTAGGAKYSTQNTAAWRDNCGCPDTHDTATCTPNITTYSGLAGGGNTQVANQVGSQSVTAGVGSNNAHVEAVRAADGAQRGHSSGGARSEDTGAGETGVNNVTMGKKVVSPRCYGRVGKEPWHAHCKNNFTNKTGCEQHSPFCEWK